MHKALSEYEMKNTEMFKCSTVDKKKYLNYKNG